MPVDIGTSSQMTSWTCFSVVPQQTLGLRLLSTYEYSLITLFVMIDTVPLCFRCIDYRAHQHRLNQVPFACPNTAWHVS